MKPWGCLTKLAKGTFLAHVTMLDFFTRKELSTSTFQKILTKPLSRFPRHVKETSEMDVSILVLFIWLEMMVFPGTWLKHWSILLKAANLVTRGVVLMQAEFIHKAMEWMWTQKWLRNTENWRRRTVETDRVYVLYDFNAYHITWKIFLTSLPVSFLKVK